MSLDTTKRINRVTVNGTEVPVVGIPTLQEKTVTPSTIAQKVVADGEYDGLGVVNVNAVTSDIDSNIIPTNIRRGTTILGVQGNLDADKPDQSKTVTPTTSQQNIVADTGYELAQVTVNAVTSSIDANIQAGNIKSGVSILGVTGTLKEGIAPSGTISITTNGTHDVTNYASANVLVPSQTPTLITKEITANGTYNASDDGADGYSSVTVNVESSGGGGGGSSTVYNIEKALISNVSVYNISGYTGNFYTKELYPYTYEGQQLSGDYAELKSAIDDAYANCKYIRATAEILRKSSYPTTITISCTVEAWSNTTGAWSLYLRSGKELISLYLQSGSIKATHYCDYTPNSNSPLTLTLKSIVISG